MPAAPRLRKPLPEKKCKLPSCGKLFIPYRGWQEFCSVSHRTEYYLATHETVAVPFADVSNNIESKS